MSLSPRKVRPAVQAGRFYPAPPGDLREQVREYLTSARKSSLSRVKAVVAPHAGFQYSGPVADSAFAAWAGEASVIRRIVLLGPSHWLDFRGIALPDVDAMSTPLGEMTIDAGASRRLRNLPGVCVLAEAHAPEHCLEVELPFLQELLPSFEIVPLVVGRETDANLELVIAQLWGGEETRFVISSDLSHYLGYEEARAFDKGTAGLVGDFEVKELSARRACGYRPLRGFLRCARSKDLKVEAVDLRTSGDTGGPRDSVVGYGAFHFGSVA